MDFGIPEALENHPAIIARRKILNDGEFTSCDNDEDRVKVTANGLIKYLWRVEDYPCELKSSEKSEMLRNFGNVDFNSPSPNLKKVLKVYSRSILYAPAGSEQLSKAYANRSAVLLRGKYYEECLEDINRALKYGFPDNLKPKLLIRKVTCTYALTGNIDFATDEALLEARALVEKLPASNRMRRMVEDIIKNPEKITSIERQVKEIPQKYVPEMKGRNPQLPGASDAIALRYSEKYGRHLVATRDIKSGEVLAIEKPYAMVVADDSIHSICTHCRRRTWNGIPCDNCVHAMFCSDECKQAAWSEYHDLECPILGKTIGSGLQHHSLMGLRLTVKAIKEAGSLENLRKRSKELDSPKGSDVEIPIDTNSYDFIYTMLDNVEASTPYQLIHWSSNSVEITYYLATKTELFGKKLMGNSEIVKDSEWFSFVAGLMSKNMRIAKNRSNGKYGEDKEDREYGNVAMLVPIYSFLNHRCYDTVKLLSFGEDVALITGFPIIKGDQIFTSYCDDYNSTPRDSRIEMYKQNWHFVCDCLACSENWSNSTRTSWLEQNLSPKVMKGLYHQLRSINELSDERCNDFMKLILRNKQYCKLVDFMYPRVKKPCIELEDLNNAILRIYVQLSSSEYPEFTGE